MVQNCCCFVMWLLTCVSASSISFERKVNVDIFKNNGGQCFQMEASFYENGWCKCDHGEMFVGHKCLAKSQMSGKFKVFDIFKCRLSMLV